MRLILGIVWAIPAPAAPEVIQPEPASSGYVVGGGISHRRHRLLHRRLAEDEYERRAREQRAREVAEIAAEEIRALEAERHRAIAEAHSRKEAKRVDARLKAAIKAKKAELRRADDIAVDIEQDDEELILLLAA